MKFREFNSFGEAALHLVTLAVEIEETLGTGLDAVLDRIKWTAESEMGVYQPEVGPFTAWAALTDATENQKIRDGYSPDLPLIARGDMLASFDTERHELVGVAGAKDPKMEWHEFGAGHVPPRPVWGPAGFRNKKTIEMLIGAATVSGLIGGADIHALLGYNFKT